MNGEWRAKRRGRPSGSTSGARPAGAGADAIQVRGDVGQHGLDLLRRQAPLGPAGRPARRRRALPDYDWPPLETELDIMGYPGVRLTVTSAAPVVFLSAKLCDVFPDGTSALVTRGFLNLTHREGHAHPERARAGRPDAGRDRARSDILDLRARPSDPPVARGHRLAEHLATALSRRPLTSIAPRSSSASRARRPGRRTRADARRRQPAPTPTQPSRKSASRRSCGVSSGDVVGRESRAVTSYGWRYQSDSLPASRSGTTVRSASRRRPVAAWARATTSTGSPGRRPRCAPKPPRAAIGRRCLPRRHRRRRGRAGCGLPSGASLGTVDPAPVGMTRQTRMHAARCPGPAPRDVVQLRIDLLAARLRHGTARMESAPGRHVARVGRLAGENLRRHTAVGVASRDDRDQRLRVRMLRRPHDVPRGPFLDDPSEVHHEDPVRACPAVERSCVIIRIARPSSSQKALEQVQDAVADGRVEHRHRLVRDQQPRVSVTSEAAIANALTLTARELVRAAIEEQRLAALSPARSIASPHLRLPRLLRPRASPCTRQSAPRSCRAP